MKRSLVLILALTVAFAFTFTGCGDSKDSKTSSADDAIQEELSVDTGDTEPSADPEDAGQKPDGNDAAQQKADPEKVSGKTDAPASNTPEKPAQKPSSNTNQSSTQKPSSGNNSAPSKPTQNNGGSDTSAKTPSKATAQSYIGKSVSSLIAAIGSPASSQYSPSCMGDGEDGELRYNGFTVYTYKENGQEKVTDVE